MAQIIQYTMLSVVTQILYIFIFGCGSDNIILFYFGNFWHTFIWITLWTI